MAKRIKVGPHYRKGLSLKVDGELKRFAPGDLLPMEFNEKIPGRFFRDKRAIWVEVEDAPVKKVRPVPTPAPKPPAKPKPLARLGSALGKALPGKEEESTEKPKRKRPKKATKSDETSE